MANNNEIGNQEEMKVHDCENCGRSFLSLKKKDKHTYKCTKDKENAEKKAAKAAKAAQKAEKAQAEKLKLMQCDLCSKLVSQTSFLLHLERCSKKQEDKATGNNEREEEARKQRDWQRYTTMF